MAAANPGVTFVGIAGHSDVGAEQNFVSKYNLNFTNLNDADGSIWARYNVPWQPAYVFYRADGSSTFVNNPTSAMSQQELAGRVAALTTKPVNQGLIGLAFAAGLVAAVNPCGFAMLPAYLLLVVRGQQSGERTGSAWRVGRALAATAGMALGFLTVFGLFGALTISAATTVQRYLPYATVVIGVVLVALGIWLLSGRELTALTPRPLGPRWAPTARQGRGVGMYGYGVSYAIASLSCTIGPFLAVTAAGFRGGSIATGVPIYLAYVAGLTLVVGVLAIAAATASSALADRLRRILPFVNRIGGALLVLVGLYVGYYGLYELRLLNTDANPAGCGDHRGRPPAGRAGRLGAPARRLAVGGGVVRTGGSPRSSPRGPRARRRAEA